ncbi:hypothetical protein KHQ82_09025 [Mycoplasmatota bacterium]|nr:hypothetical protein KHQ82_09025 [Mycoplasmatota bacterium]
MKGLLLSISLLTGGFAATYDGVQNQVKDYYHMATQKLGFEETQEYGGFGMHGGMNRLFIDEEMKQFMDYQIELIEAYDFSAMTAEEIREAQSQMNQLLDQKAIELGLDLPDFGAGFRPGMMYGYASDEQTELMYYMHNLMFSYDWASMSEEETINARETIDSLVEDKANELGLDYYGYGDYMGGFMNGYGSNSRFYGSCHGSYNNYRRNTSYRSSRGF